MSNREGQDGRAQTMRHGPGWKHVGGPVWEHANGSRVHLLGFVRLPDGRFLSASKWPESKDASLLIRINGGNRKRGLMAWALSITPQIGGT